MELTGKCLRDFCEYNETFLKRETPENPLYLFQLIQNFLHSSSAILIYVAKDKRGPGENWFSFVQQVRKNLKSEIAAKEDAVSRANELYNTLFTKEPLNLIFEPYVNLQ
jgi:hypothetical protein